MVVFSVVDPLSLQSAKTKWIPEAKIHCPNTPILLVGTKHDLREDPKYSSRIISYQQVYHLSKEYDAIYCECSSVTMEGVKDVFQTVVQIAYVSSNMKKQKFSLIPPPFPSTEQAPVLNIAVSSFAMDMKNLLETKFASNITFCVDGKLMRAHSIVLCAASKQFSKLLLRNWEQGEEIVVNDFPGIMSVKHVHDQFVINIHKEISASIFQHVLEFLYTGKTFTKDIQGIKHVASIFKISEIITYCENIENRIKCLNPSLTKWVNERCAENMKRFFFQKKLFSDMSFVLDTKEIIPAHKAIVCTRCEVLKKMLSGDFVESKGIVDVSDTPKEYFIPFLEFLYSDRVTITESNAVGVLITANKFGMTRLVTQCELFIAKCIDRGTKEKIEKADINVFALLQFAQTHNAKQLEKFCLHFISTHYQALSRHAEYKSLSRENRKYIEEHQWPPKSYLKDLAEYQQQLEKEAKKILQLLSHKKLVST